jgi:hypothetical protein
MYVLLINYYNFHSYVQLIYPDELEEKGNHRIWHICLISGYFTEMADWQLHYMTSVMILNLQSSFFFLCSNIPLVSLPYDKLNLKFAIVNFLFLCSNIPFSPPYVCIWYARTLCVWELFKSRSSIYKKSWCCRVFKIIILQILRTL